jgi:hypothetical protein
MHITDNVNSLAYVLFDLAFSFFVALLFSILVDKLERKPNQ